ncbi:MAG: DNA translocase FtsK 4TM domain-containing protein [Bacteroidales bacterium]|nr:DNA translocase FtsK 4TM domain-containing protein [Bacteroidales bacterium]
MAKANTSKKKKKVRPTGKFVEFWKSERGRKLRGACYILLALFLTVATFSFFISWPSQSNWLGRLGYHLANALVQDTFGIASLGFSFLLFLYGLRLWKVNLMPWWRTFWVTLFWMLWISTVLGYLNGRFFKSETFSNYVGITGKFVSEQLYLLIRWGVVILLIFVAVVVLIFIHRVRFKMPKMPEVSLPKVNLKEKINNLKAKEQEEKEEEEETVETAIPPTAPKPKEEKVTFDIDDEFARINQKAQQGSQDTPKSATQKEVDFTIDDTHMNINSNADEEEDGEKYSELEATQEGTHYGFDQLYDPHLDLKQYQMPSTDLLTDWETKNTKVTKEELVANKDLIVETLRNYGIEIVQITASPGPTVTLYEIKPAPGVRISKIKNLEDDIALSLSALGIRIIAPIPGRGTVGIEVPNANPQIVSMKNMLECDAFVKNTKMELPIAFGKTISNEPFVTDLAKMPHLLMAGATGTGKSVGLNAVIASLLYKKHPSELKFVMVDPKKVELSLYNKIERHYLAKLPDSDEAIITDVKKVVRTLNSLCIEMDQRYDLLRLAGVRKITEYNDKFIHRHLNPENGHRYLPYIVLVIDEFADLIMTAGKEVEMPICRLAQLARAVGIHLIIATQRPTTNIITGTIKANFPARIAFKVTSGIDSRTILDCSGAQRLIGRGDMLISLSGSDLVRIQCALIETEEIEQLADFIGSQRGYPDGFLLPEYLDENEEPNKDFDPKQKDEFFNDAARLVVASQFGSTSLLQRKLQLGYNRAGRIIDQLEAAGIVGPYNGSKAREVLVHDETQLEELLRQL